MNTSPLSPETAIWPSAHQSLSHAIAVLCENSFFLCSHSHFYAPGLKCNFWIIAGAMFMAFFKPRCSTIHRSQYQDEDHYFENRLETHSDCPLKIQHSIDHSLLRKRK